ncbi:MAG: DUF1203 domain-containing protein [Proteobacteria bacterium]|nr:DUF1203 domain-containing protein [Pseudomonadota bacterium]
MPFRITGLPRETFADLIGAPEAELEARGVRRVRIDQPHGAPCRITLDDAQPGETVLLANYTHQPADTPFRASHAVFVRETPGLATFDAEGEVPPALARRTLSARAFDSGDMMIDADLVEGSGLDGFLEGWFQRPEIAYVQLHYAKWGCYAARAERA